MNSTGSARVTHSYRQEVLCLALRLTGNLIPRRRLQAAMGVRG